MHHLVTNQPRTEHTSEVRTMCEDHFSTKQFLVSYYGDTEKWNCINVCSSSALRRNRATQQACSSGDDSLGCQLRRSIKQVASRKHKIHQEIFHSQTDTLWLVAVCHSFGTFMSVGIASRRQMKRHNWHNWTKPVLRNKWTYHFYIFCFIQSSFYSNTFRAPVTFVLKGVWETTIYFQLLSCLIPNSIRMSHNMLLRRHPVPRSTPQLLKPVFILPFCL